MVAATGVGASDAGSLSGEADDGGGVDKWCAAAGADGWVRRAAQG